MYLSVAVRTEWFPRPWVVMAGCCHLDFGFRKRGEMSWPLTWSGFLIPVKEHRGGVYIHGIDGLTAFRPGLGNPRSHPDHWNAGGLFPKGKFPPMLFFTKRPSMVAPEHDDGILCLLYTSPSPRDGLLSRMPSSA